MINPIKFLFDFFKQICCLLSERGHTFMYYERDGKPHRLCIKCGIVRTSAQINEAIKNEKP